MAVICTKKYSTERFIYDSERNVFSAYISDFGPLRERVAAPFFGRVFDDAVDEGIVLVSHKTGTEVVYAVDRTDDNEGDIDGWWLKAISQRTGHPVRVGEAGYGTEVLVIND